MSSEDAWGQLVSLTDFETAPISLVTDKFVIGRGPDCELSLPENKLISGRHCFIQRDEDGKVTLSDSSTNGTLLNMTYKITKGKSKELQHGDEFYIVYKKENPAANVGFVYQDMVELQREEGTQEYSPPPLMDATLEDSDCNYLSPEKDDKKRKSDENNEKDDKKRKSDENNVAEPQVKKQKTEEQLNKPSTTQSGNNLNTEKKDENKTSKVCDNSEVKKAESETKAVNSSEASKTSKPATVPEKDDIEENLQCMICQEIMHDCISLQPCLHSFCAGCYSDWMSRSNECPSCRKKVERITKNHIVNNLIEAYLKVHPAKKRPEEDMKELNAKNKISNDMLYPKDKPRHTDSSDYSDTDESDEDSPPVPAQPYFPPVQQPPPLFGFGTPVFGVQRVFKTVCRQCPDYKDPLQTGQNTGLIGGMKAAMDTVKKLITGEEKPGTSDGGPVTGNADDGASTSGESKPATGKDDVKEMPTPPAYVCPVNQNHVLCQCCLQPMPDFRTQPFNTPANAGPQQCSICYRAYCHAYWGCRKADCLGCLNKFKEMNFGRKALIGLILDNQHESEIFRDYIDAKGISVKDVVGECCRQMDAGRFTVMAQGTHAFTSEKAVCYACGIGIFRKLAFQYRKTIKKEEFPEEVRKRPDCYWGSGCRTQKNKPHHAKNFNHICDQTRQV